MATEPTRQEMCEAIERARGRHPVHKLIDGEQVYIGPDYFDDPKACFEAMRLLGLAYRLESVEDAGVMIAKCSVWRPKMRRVKESDYPIPFGGESDAEAMALSIYEAIK